jgi:hypothetical protein
MKFRPDAVITLTDLWSGSSTTLRGERAFSLKPRETLIFRAKGVRRLPEGRYLSEQPASVNPAIDGVVVPQEEPLLYRPIFWSGTHGTGEHPRYGGWGGAQADSTPYGQRINLGGRPFETGIGVLANSRLEVRNRGFGKFSAVVGVDDSAHGKSRPVTFLVYGDGKLIAQSKPMRFGQAPVALDASVTGVKLIELVARTGVRGGPAVPVAWGDAARTR